MFTHWTPGIGDPSAIGWFTVIAYFSTAVLCARAALGTTGRAQDVTRREHQERCFWLGVLLIFIILGINKQLDLQELFTDLARNHAKAHGWYEARRIYQLVFTVTVAVAAVATEIVLFASFRRHRAPVKLALIGLAFTGAFVVVRAATFHHVDLLLGSRILSVRINWLFELTGVATVATAAQWYSGRIPEAPE